MPMMSCDLSMLVDGGDLESSSYNDKVVVLEW